MDDTTALGLLVTWFMNMKIPDHPLPDAIILQGTAALKTLWAANGYTPAHPVNAALYSAAVTWAGMPEVDKVRWLGRLCEACNPDAAY